MSFENVESVVQTFRYQIFMCHCYRSKSRFHENYCEDFFYNS